jgi:glycogen operon protein
METGEIRWHGVRLNQPDWSDHSHTISFTVRSLSGKLETHFIINAFRETLCFELPELEPGRQWRRWIDTSLASPNDIHYWDQALVIDSQEYQVEAHTIVVMISSMDRPEVVSIITT